IGLPEVSFQNTSFWIVAPVAAAAARLPTVPAAVPATVLLAALVPTALALVVTVTAARPAVHSTAANAAASRRRARGAVPGAAQSLDFAMRDCPFREVISALRCRMTLPAGR